MGDLILSYAMEKMLEKVGSLAEHGISLAWGFKGKLEKLKQSLLMIQDVLQDAEKRQVSDRFVRRWLEKLQDVAYDAEDFLDELAYEIVQQDLKGKVCSFFSLSNPITLHLNMALKMEKIYESLDEINKDSKNFGFMIDRTSQQLSSNPKTDSLLGSSEVVVGRNEDVSKIINLISSCNQVLSIVPIVGMAGLGKTTLAKKVCEGVREKELFDITFWVCVSDDFDDKKILGGMLETLDGSRGGIENIDAILKHLQRELEMKKFLLVLDDVWNEERRKWENLKNRMQKVCGKTGNVVIVTTRNEQVASIMETSSSHRHKLKNLSDDGCWSIISKKLFENGGPPICSNLEAIGREIATKCRGIPLVANVIGGTLRSKRQKHEWELIKESKMWESMQENDGILHILKSSFDHLSPPLKQCFAYCSIFPKDFFIEKKQLIQIWMAEGLVGPFNERMEDMADEYFNALLAHSFFQDVEKDEYENVTCCKMHPLMHDLALSVSKSKTLIVDASSTLEASSSLGNTPCVRHLNLISCEIVVPKFLSVDARKLHSLFARVDVLNKSWKFKALRTLNLSDARINELPASIGKLKHLRYLDISRTDIKALPKSITRLYHLQTLRFSPCRFLEKLPQKMKNLINLRHLDYSFDHQTPTEVSRLTCLQTLSLFGVSQRRGHKIEELGYLNELRGQLRIVSLQNVVDKVEAERANLSQKPKLYELGLEWSSKKASSDLYTNVEEVLESLQPHQDIRSLEIKNYMGDKFPPWLSIPTLNHLVTLKLNWCMKCKKLPTLGHLSHLKILEIRRMYNVSCIGDEFYKYSECRKDTTTLMFPALKQFFLENMEGLEDWMVPASDATTIFPCLEELYISQCRQLKSIPSMAHLSSKLKKLKIDDCGSLHHLSGEFRASTPLKYLSITNCENLGSIPSRLQCCTALEELFMGKCNELMSIIVGDDVGGVDGEWQSLRFLEIRHCENLVFIPSGIHCCRALEKLIIYDCNKLKSIGVCSGREWQSIRYLEIRDCRRLVSIPSGLHCCTALEKLIIYGCSELMSIIVNDDDGGFGRYWQSLREVQICKCSKLTHLPIRGLLSCASLEILKIMACNGLISIDDGDQCDNPTHVNNGCSHLVVLSIYQCPSLRDFPRDIFSCLTKLKQLIIGPFSKELEAFPAGILNSIHHLRGSLRELRIIGWDKVKSLPHQLQHLTALEKLSIKNFPGEDCFHLTLLKKLGNDSSLEELGVFSAGILNSLDLDKVLKSLAHEIQDPTVLEKVRIKKFPGEDIFHHTLLKKSKNGSSSEKLEVRLVSLKSPELDIVLKSLPHEIQDLTVLEKVRIKKFPGEDIFHHTLLKKSKNGSSSEKLEVRLVSLNSPELDIVLKSLPYQLPDPTAVGKLRIEKSPTTDCFHLTLLKKLEEGSSSEGLEVFPADIQNSLHLDIVLKGLSCQLQDLIASSKWVTLKFMKIEKALPDWLGNLSSLQELKIGDCENVKHLPSSKAMKHLSALKQLDICSCPSLSENCDEHHSVTEWPKISHLPYIRTDCGIIKGLMKDQ